MLEPCSSLSLEEVLHNMFWGDGTGHAPYGGIDCPTIKVLAEALLKFSTNAYSPMGEVLPET